MIIPNANPTNTSSKFLPIVSGMLLLEECPSPSPLIPEILD